MFFPEKIKSIRESDVVLEIGPGATPHPRANAFLELAMQSEVVRLRQRGGVNREPNFNNRPINYYDGNNFPFSDKQFDYVICSHVIEHVPNLDLFMKEVFRVGKDRGYIEFPTPVYDYMFDFDVHINFVYFDDKEQVLTFIPKNNTDLKKYSKITDKLRELFEAGWDDFVFYNKELFFCGIEYDRRFTVREEVNMLNILEFATINKKSIPRSALDRILRKIRW